MTVRKEQIVAAFPDYTVTMQPRPDGSQLLTLERDGEQIKRIIPSPQLSAPVRVEWLISALRRDLAKNAGMLPPAHTLQSQHPRSLPQYVA